MAYPPVRPFRLLVVLLLAVFGAGLAAAGPLHEATRSGNIEEVRRLIGAGTDLNARDSDGFTPLMAAGELGDYAIAELLVDSGASVNGANRFNATALHKVLDGDRPLPGESLAPNRRRLALFLIMHGSDVKFVGYNRTTPLHVAAMWGDLAVIEALIQEGADVNAKTEKGFTPLYVAQVLLRNEAVELLRNNGAH